MPEIDVEKRYFLKCPHCSYLTEIKTESVNYCYNCTRKFKNNFNEWSLKNGKDISQYKLLECESFSMDGVNEFVRKHNQAYIRKNLTREEKIRRKYIEEGVPLDRGITSEWSLKEQVKSQLWLLILLVIVVLLAYFIK